MGLIEKFRNRETKKKLREENARLRAKINSLQKTPDPKFCPVKIKNLQQMQASVEVPAGYASAVEMRIKNKLAQNLIDRLYPFVEYDVENTIYGGRIYTANLYVATGDMRDRE